MITNTNTSFIIFKQNNKNRYEWAYMFACAVRRKTDLGSFRTAEWRILFFFPKWFLPLFSTCILVFFFLIPDEWAHMSRSTNGNLIKSFIFSFSLEITSGKWKIPASFSFIFISTPAIVIRLYLNIIIFCCRQRCLLADCPKWLPLGHLLATIIRKVNVNFFFGNVVQLPWI